MTSMDPTTISIMSIAIALLAFLRSIFKDKHEPMSKDIEELQKAVSIAERKIDVLLDRSNKEEQRFERIDTKTDKILDRLNESS